MDFDILPLILACAGGYLLLKLRFFFLLHPIRTAARGLRAIKDKRAARSFFLALAGTLGVGNVFGVAVGILVGGAGSLLWLLVSMLFAMVIKYAEVVLTSDNLFHDTDTHGGFFYVIRNSFTRGARTLSLIYAVSTLLLSLFLGAALQTDAIRETVIEVCEIPDYQLGLILTLLTLAAIVGGASKIERITTLIIPLTTLIYIFITFSIIITNVDRMPEAISEIVGGAFNIESAVGGGLGFLLSRPVREGFARGILSNEAGAGTSSIAHARCGILSPASAGILGIFEVWFDTGLVCMLTGFSILLSVDDLSAFNGGMELVMYAVGNRFGSVGKLIVLFCVFAFAFATVICWYYYGTESWCELFGRKKRAFFLPIFLCAVYTGCYSDSYTLVNVIDILMLIATVLTLSAVLKNSDRVRALSENGGVIDCDYSRLRPRLIKGNVFSREAKRRRR